MSIELVNKYQPYTDEQFKAESRISLVTNKDFEWTGAHSIKVYKISTASMNDYGRTGPITGNWSRYGAISDLSATTEEMTTTKDRSFIFNIDKLDEDETARQLSAASALARQTREKIIPEVDTYTYGVMAAGAGTKAEAKVLTAADIYEDITAGTEVMDNEEIPETERVIIVTPAVYRLMKRSPEIAMETDIGHEMRLKGVIAMLDGMAVQKVPAVRLPDAFGFMIAHPSATVAPVKLEDYNIHENTIYGSGAVVTGRICYDAFVLENKKKGIYYQPATVE